MNNNRPQYVAVYCPTCGYVDKEVSTIAIDAIRRLAQTEDAIVDCKHCGTKIKVNFNEDMLTIGRKGKVKLPETTQW